MMSEFPRFNEVIRNNNQSNNFENELINFLDDCLTAANRNELTEKKERFILRNYTTRPIRHKKLNLFDSEYNIVTEKLMSTCGVLIDFNCTECGTNESLTEPQMKTFIDDHTNHLHPAEAIQAIFNLEYIFAAKTCTNELCKQPMTAINSHFATPAPWIIPIRLALITGGRLFGLNQLASLPLTVIHEEYTYVLAGITFLKDAHFRSILAVPGGFIHYDGTDADPPLVVCFNEAVDSMATLGALIQTIIYLKTTKPKKKPKPTW